MSLTPALFLMLAAAPFCALAAISDLRTMTIKNATNLGLFLAFVVVGIFVFPLEEYGFRLIHAVVMYAVGMALTLMRLMGGGDAKFIIAMSPYIAVQDLTGFVFLLAILSLVTVAIHRGVGLIKPLKPRLAGWKSWSAEKRKFPFGVTLGATLFIYLCLKAFRA